MPKVLPSLNQQLELSNMVYTLVSFVEVMGLCRGRGRPSQATARATNFRQILPDDLCQCLSLVNLSAFELWSFRRQVPATTG